MLVEIRCDKFAEEYRIIRLNPGLNTVLGSTEGGNALGKSTFLWIVDYAFGGDGYCTAGSDVKRFVKDHTLFFTFLFDGTYHYFYRTTSMPKQVFRNDKDGHLIEKMSLDEYRKFLASCYHPCVPMDEVYGHYFRIYGRENTYEQIPLLTKPRESDEKAVDFLLRLFGKQSVLNALHAAEEELGVKASQWQASKKQLKTFEKIEENEQTIQALKRRLEKMMTQDGNAGMEYLGFDAKAYEQVAAMRQSMRKLIRQRDRLKARIDNLRFSNEEFINEAVREDFTQLAEFFPDVNLKGFEDIENFHVRIREILKEEANEEIVELEPLLQSCEAEIRRLQHKMEEAGIASELAQRVLSQCVSVSKRIDELEADNRILKHEKELQEARVLAERRMEQLIADQKATIDEIVSAINAKLKALNQAVTSGEENPPTLAITDSKEIHFGTVGNTSEGTACKSMVLYDLAILALTQVPAVIHDGNILHSISRDHFKKLLELYEASGKQIFIAADRAEDEILKQSTVLHLTEEHRLFGFSWGRSKP
jgi:uncharacterized protein YydD (DUF2326 family)